MRYMNQGSSDAAVQADILGFLQHVGGRSANQLATALGLPTDLVEAALGDLAQTSQLHVTTVDGVTLYRMIHGAGQRPWSRTLNG